MTQQIIEKVIEENIAAANTSLGDMVAALAESTRLHQAALNELQETMIARGFVTRESIARARAEMEAENAL